MQMVASRNPVKVTVAVPARLHLGFLDLDGGLGRRFGSIGVAISDLHTRVAVERAAATAEWNRCSSCWLPSLPEPGLETETARQI